MQFLPQEGNDTYGYDIEQKMENSVDVYPPSELQEYGIILFF